jgi:MFS family permease
VLAELRSKAPMLNLRLLRNRIFRTASLVSVCTMGVYSGYLFLMPEFLQQARGASALSSGLTTFPGAIGVLISSQIAARVYPHLGPRRMIVGSLCGLITVFTLLGLTVGLDTSIWLIRLLIFCSGASMAWSLIAVQTSSFATISSADTGRAAALFQTQNQVAGSIGVAVLVTVVSSSSRAGTGLVTAFHHAFLTVASLMVIAVLFALTIRDADAAATMRRREPVPAAPAPPAVVPPGIGDGTADRDPGDWSQR